MRVSSSMYAKSLYSSNNSKLNNELFDVNKQIASGLKIQYASDDISIFSETMRLDNELSTIGQIKKSTANGYKISNQSDVTLSEFTDEVDRIKTLLLQASNGTNDETSLNSIVGELRAIEGALRSLSNTSINGKYLFSGSAVDVKPISDDGTYNGNDVSMKSFLGSNNNQAYNITGANLFLGEENTVKKSVTTNVVNNNLIADTPSLHEVGFTGLTGSINSNSTIRELMGDTDNNIDSVTEQHFFYVRGVQSDGTSINKRIGMKDDEKVSDLLNHIGTAYGNGASKKIVDVSMNGSGQILIADKISGSSKLEFHMVGAVDFSGGGAAKINDGASIDSLDGGSNDFLTAAGINPAGAPGLFVKEFMKSDYTAANGAPSIDGLLYDRTQFSVNGNVVSSNVNQISKIDNSFATPPTKLIDVSSRSLDGEQFSFAGVDVNGSAFSAQIDFLSTGTTFSLDGGVNNYTVFDADSPRAAMNSDEMTYQQLMDVMNMVVTANTPATTNTDTDYDKAIELSYSEGMTSLSYDGRIEFSDLNIISTNARISIYDSNSGTINNNGPVDSSSTMLFNTNNALTVRDPKTDFFKTIDNVIQAVENYKNNPDHTTGDIRSLGMQEGMSMIDDLQDHLFRTQSISGAQSNRLTTSLEKTELLEVSTITLRSEVLDTDLAESALRLKQLTLNYEAMLSTVGNASKLSLVNYM